jgi:murein DD-endopeptidase MepM/ murein hydrolase activator NlpD
MRLLLLLTMVLCANAAAQTVYRYQDVSGRWHFTDRKPKETHETLQIAAPTPVPQVPQLIYQQEDDGSQRLVSINPWLAPVQFDIRQGDTRIAEWVVEARGHAPVRHNDQPVEWRDNYEYHYRLGRPIPRGDLQPLQPPIPPGERFRISQGFNGHYSHKEEPGRHAVDIAMQVGEGIHAARDGLVVTVKDDYHMGGVDRFFLDKANYVRVLHSDDTFALYAHILLGSAVVKEGQRVKAGDRLASAGTSGYSSGPHLHFVLQRNNGSEMVSEPFRFQLGREIFPPVVGQWLTRE